ncbi:MAG: SDR family NAD(P)-dependent oxidoreductase [Planctomycetota bacterium]|jgi:3-hydroxy acid dehydrogenase / malonic semialdehyde reductase|nr:SDR family NAD(P)-dependent oxidoreductase [Planctomycetota bacterium]
MTQTLELAQRVAVVTGASSGIGQDVARRLAVQGMHLVLGARRCDRLEALSAELSDQHGVRCLAHPLDVTDSASVASFGEAADAFAGESGVHLLVNNAGAAFGVARLPTATLEDEADWQAMLDVNVMGLLRVTRRFVSGMVARGSGHVIHMGSLAGLETYEGGSVYCATKAAVRVISKALRLELLGSGVRVCCVNPGLVETEFSQVRLGSEEAATKVYEGMTPLTGNEVAETVEWVARLPEFVNIEEVTLQPVDQASAQKVHRT